MVETLVDGLDHPEGELEVFSTALPHFDGCAVTVDGRWLWIVESREPTGLRGVPLHYPARSVADR